MARQRKGQEPFNQCGWNHWSCKFAASDNHRFGGLWCVWEDIRVVVRKTMETIVWFKNFHFEYPRLSKQIKLNILGKSIYIVGLYDKAKIEEFNVEKELYSRLSFWLVFAYASIKMTVRVTLRDKMDGNHAHISKGFSLPFTLISMIA